MSGGSGVKGPPPEVLQVVLEHQVDPDGADRIIVVGVFGQDDPLPPTKPGRSRNVVQVFRGVPVDVKAFRITR